MGKYLKKFDTHAEYNTYITGSDKVLPNVSYCVDANDVHYNPWVETRLVCKYNITDTSSATTLRTDYEQNMFKSMEIDGVLLDNMVTEYQFSTTGEHTVKYELYDETKVGNSAPLFYNITTLSSVFIPNNVTTIGNNVFMNCSGLTSVTIGSGVTTIGETAFQNCTSLTSITIGNGVTSIGANAFNACTGLTSIMIPDSVTTIGSGTFERCSGLTSVTIGNGVTSIGQYAFTGCSDLTSITIPNSVTTIGQQAFIKCTSLTSVTVEATTPPTLGSSVFNNNANGRKIYVPSESVNTYKAASGWSDYAADIEAIQ